MNLKLITRSDFTENTDEQLFTQMTEAVSQLQEMQKKVKITLKKNYIQDILMQCKGA